MGKDKSLKKEFEEKFEEQNRTPRPHNTSEPIREIDIERDRGDADYRRETSETIPVIEEYAHVGKKVIEKAKVRISKTVQEEEVTIDLPSVDEEVDVERVPINEYVRDMPPPVRYEGDITIIPVLKEVPVIEKRILLVEEIHIRKRQTRTHESQPVRLRKEEINIKRENPDAPNQV
ncbi:YsnF/AvaK domain-containing protein [Botryobacter ruber]|uniref:YsnF/AvaK domain-containing protein n=1 Tax=Botryobacter ruber TaxID=2171629 RepID=UPI000E0C60D7|nr:YsnF/AvaK domain-containing protein [Botryobacter ruber]